MVITINESTQTLFVMLQTFILDMAQQTFTNETKSFKKKAKISEVTNYFLHGSAFLD